MSQLSKVKHSRNQWKAKAKQRSDHNRFLRKQLARLKAERAQAKQELKESQIRLRQLESQVPAVAVRPKVDVVGLALNLF
jgi:septal ring factor EnvC (AmiA/AmiB activator)